MPGSHHVRTLHTLDEMRTLLQVADEVWGPPAGAMVSADFLMALSHTGGYVAGLYDTSQESPSTIERMIGCSFGMLGRFRGTFVLHSHITGVIENRQHTGFGRMIKQHQRAWAKDNGLDAITWTFDPLVRRNGWFNLHCLGATAEEYHIDFYGPLGDEINGSDETDRLLAHWDISSTRARRAAEAVLAAIDPESGDTLVATPEDVVTLRRRDPEEARRWRVAVRDQLRDAFGSSHIVGMTRSGDYVVRRRDSHDGDGT